MKNPTYTNPSESHAFSIASTPKKQYFEFCIRSYGDWTRALHGKKEGEMLQIAGPFGNFIWKEQMNPVVFMAGGVGISPFYSILTSIMENNLSPSVTLLYGSRTPDTILYRKELETLERKLPHLTLVHVLSDVPSTDMWKEYRGFVTEEIIKKELPTQDVASLHFFISGPPIFIEKMRALLKNLGVPLEKIIDELDVRSKT